MPINSVTDSSSLQQIQHTYRSFLFPRMKIIRAIILLSVGSSSATENIKDPKGLGVRSGIDDCDAYCKNSYKSPYNQATCVRVLESIGVDCSRGMDFLQEEDGAASPEIATSKIKESKGLEVHASIDDCNAYCRTAYRYQHNQATCVRVLINLGIDCSRGMDFLQEDDTVSLEAAVGEIEESKGKGPHFRVSVSGVNSNLRGSTLLLENDADDSSHGHDGDKEKGTDVGAKEFASEFVESEEALTCTPEGEFCRDSSQCCGRLKCIAHIGPRIFCSY